MTVEQVADEVEVAIVDAAERCFEHLGVAKTTMLQVAAEAEVSRTTLYKRFAAIDDVLQAVFLREFDRFEAKLSRRLRPLADPGERLVEVIVSTAENAPHNAGIARLVEGQRNRAEARALAVGRAALNDRVERLIGEPLDELAVAGRLRDDVPRVELIEWIRRIVTSLVVSPQSARRSADERRNHVAGFVLPGISRPTPTDEATDRRGALHVS